MALNEFDVASTTSVPLVLLLFLTGTVALWFMLGRRLARMRAGVVGVGVLASVLLVGYGTRAARVRGQNITVRSSFSSTFRQYTVGDIESYAIEFIKARSSRSGTYLLTLTFRDGTTADFNHRMQNYKRLRQFLAENHIEQTR